ncbi:hypothetical protein SY2F82_19810 [Streptomyces sp. Y2F8-2]|nr:hypothetical protein SY2F82_19810 [Streptomyces sp. Y2F8-2]
MSPVKPVPEAAAQAFADATANPPFLHDIDPVEGRKAVDSVYAARLRAAVPTTAVLDQGVVHDFVRGATTASGFRATRWETFRRRPGTPG